MADSLYKQHNFKAKTERVSRAIGSGSRLALAHSALAIAACTFCYLWRHLHLTRIVAQVSERASVERASVERASAECASAECASAECASAECASAECASAECASAECASAECASAERASASQSAARPFSSREQTDLLMREQIGRLILIHAMTIHYDVYDIFYNNTILFYTVIFQFLRFGMLVCYCTSLCVISKVNAHCGPAQRHIFY